MSGIKTTKEIILGDTKLKEYLFNYLVNIPGFLGELPLIKNVEEGMNSTGKGKKRVTKTPQ